MRMLILGHGYTAAALTPRLLQDGWIVVGTTRHDAARVSASGADPVLWPGDDQRVRAEIRRADAILISVAPDGSLAAVEGDRAAGGGAAVPEARQRRSQNEAPDRVIAEFEDALIQSNARWVGYLSSTSVYGDHAGAWVDETTPPNPTSHRARARLAAEHAWSQIASRAGWPLTIFRLAGIYGPGRGPLAKLRAGSARRIIKPDQVFSRIHVDDIAGAILADLKLTRHGSAVPNAPRSENTRILNICDDDPLPPQDAIEMAARLADLPVPPAEGFADAEMTPMARSFYRDSKRVRNNRLKEQLGYALKYPDLRSGLQAIIDAER
ncbi:SDR family oxidoreductase [Paracoccus sp. SCSIO 75233]|uniref:SDR family oxidoreductase n=1 Tax=Paracoccus sp. SCSIO 75233 TaxID=3017782 RepID=UPI0022F0ABD4|nr:SDR family oxidoreductase [Paracoccus sp. SCSIO 75233]WBU53274.1 SDR family oxidoreductase [Paracoccus sp. SCSIO 75233]